MSNCNCISERQGPSTEWHSFILKFFLFSRLHRYNAIKVGLIYAVCDLAPTVTVIWAVVFAGYLMDKDELTFGNMIKQVQF